MDNSMILSRCYYKSSKEKNVNQCLEKDGPSQIPTAVVVAKSPMKGIWLFSHWFLQATKIGL